MVICCCLGWDGGRHMSLLMWTYGFLPTVGPRLRTTHRAHISTGRFANDSLLGLRVIASCLCLRVLLLQGIGRRVKALQRQRMLRGGINSGGRPHESVGLFVSLFGFAKVQGFIRNQQFIVKEIGHVTEELEVCLVGLDLVVVGDAGVVGFYFQSSVLPDCLNYVLDRLLGEGAGFLIAV